MTDDERLADLQQVVARARARATEIAALLAAAQMGPHLPYLPPSRAPTATDTPPAGGT